MGTESGAAAAASSTVEKEGSLWSILPSFDPQQDDPREYRDKITFLHGICPKKDKVMLAPRLAMLMKGTAWAQVKLIDPSKLTDPDNGIKALLQAISTWEETEEMQLYDKFEKAMFRTTQRTGETTQSYVNRLSVSFHELGTLTVKDIKGFIVLRQSSLSVEDKKRVLTMAGDPLTQEGVEKAMRQLSTKVLVGQRESRKKVYPVNYIEDEPEEAHFVQETENIDEEHAIVLLAEQGDEDAQLIKDFEDQLIEVCQDNQDLAMCYNSYAEARAKIRDRIRHRGFWPSNNKGRGKGGKKGAKSDVGRMFPKKQTLAERIASSNCRKCGARGHWKWECPQKDSSHKEDVNIAVTTDVMEEEQEIFADLPEGVRGPGTVEELFEMLAEKDCQGSTCHPPGIVFNSNVNGEFMETAFVCSLAKSKINGHSLGTALMEAMSRKTEGEGKVGAFDRATGCPGIIDTGASKTVIGQSKIKLLIRSLPAEIQRKMNWKKSETVFRFGNNAVLPSVGALFLPFGSRWMKVEVVAGETPFLLSNSFLKSIDADVCTGRSTLRLNQLGYEVPLRTNNKGLFVVELAEVIAAFSREHQCQKVELVTTVTVEQQHQQQRHHQSAAEVAQHNDRESANVETSVNCERRCHGVQAGHDGVRREAGSTTAFSRGSEHDLYDGDRRGGDQETSRSAKSPAVGTNGDGRGKVQGNVVHGCDQQRPGVLQLDEEAPAPVERLGSLLPELREGLGSDTWLQPGGQVFGSNTKGTSDESGEEDPGSEELERRRRGDGDDRKRGTNDPRAKESDRELVVIGQKSARSGEREQHAGRGESGVGSAVAAANCNAARPTDQSDQEHGTVKEMKDQPNEQLGEPASTDEVNGESVETTSEVIQRGHEILCHLEGLSNTIETELQDLLMVTPGEKSLRHTTLRTRSRPCGLDLLEIYCESESTLTTTINEMGMKAKRFTRQDGDLSTAEGREKLWKMIDREQPRNIWVAPECKFWGNFSRWNSGRSTATAETIQAGRERERKGTPKVVL